MVLQMRYLHELEFLQNQRFFWGGTKLEVIKIDKYYSLRLNLFVLFEKSNFLREHHLLFYLSYKNIYIYKTTLK